MGTQQGRPQSCAELNELQRGIAHWRRTRTKLSPMPEELWTQAARVARKVGVSAVAAVVGLGYARLKQRTAVVARDNSAAQAPAAFVEFSGDQLLGSGTGSVVELADGSGARLTIRLYGGQQLDVAGVVAVFRGGLR